jgi:hypothetical protein
MHPLAKSWQRDAIFLPLLAIKMTEEPRRFPAPWYVDKIPGGYVVKDAQGQVLAYVYARTTNVEAARAKVLTADEARQIADDIAKLPSLLKRDD